MAHSNHYKTLDVNPSASQAEIKQAYRRLAKLFHPDSNRATADHNRIADINLAYEVLGDPHRRQFYDRGLSSVSQADTSGFTPQAKKRSRQQRTEAAQRQYRQQRQAGGNTDEQLERWLDCVYQPINRSLYQIVSPLQDQIDDLSADPFDDELMENFQSYLEDCRQRLAKAQAAFASIPNPANVAGVAAHLYYCLNQVGDGIDELERFTYNYSEQYLHIGQELFRIANGLRREAQAAIRDIT